MGSASCLHLRGERLMELSSSTFHLGKTLPCRAEVRSLRASQGTRYGEHMGESAKFTYLVALYERLEESL
jgi:hypothetical protein